MNAQEARELSKLFDVKHGAEKWIEENLDGIIKSRASDGFRFADVACPGENIRRAVFDILRSKGYELNAWDSLTISW